LTFYGDEQLRSEKALSVTSAKLLQAAAEIVGGNRALAERLGVSHSLLLKFVADTVELPDPLLLAAVDIILADRRAGPPLDPHPAVRPAQGAVRDN
jgi:hypothetical protein